MAEESAKAIGRLDVLAELARMSASVAKRTAIGFVVGVLPLVVIGALTFGALVWLSQLIGTDVLVLMRGPLTPVFDWIIRIFGTLILLGLGIRVWRAAKERVQEREAA